MAPGALLNHTETESTESRPSKRIKMISELHSDGGDEYTDEIAAELHSDDDEYTDEIAAAIETHPLHIKPEGNAYTASENIKSRCGVFARLPDELLNLVLESFDHDCLVRLGSTCKALYAFTRLDELWRALFIA